MIVFAAVVHWVRREIFGPVLPIVPVKDVDEAIAIIRAKCVALSFLSHLLPVGCGWVLISAHSLAHSQGLPARGVRVLERPEVRKEGCVHASCACVWRSPLPVYACVGAVLTDRCP